MEDFDTLHPRYPPLHPPQRKTNPYEYFDGDRECIQDYLQEEKDDDDFAQFSRPKSSRADDDDSSESEEDTDPTSSFTFQLKSVGPKLIPFFKTLGMYFVIFVPADKPSWFAVLIKCLPVASLALFIVLHGISLSQQHTFARKIFAGLLLSCIGDALLVWPEYFLEGMIAFAFAQVSYIWAFGPEPANFTLGVVIYAITSVGLGLIMPGLMVSKETGLMVGVPVYFILLTTMLWRALARIQLFEDIFTWSKLCSCFGSIFFVVSDSALGINKFFTEVPNSQAVIMGTYYTAQLFMALSVVNSHKAVIHPELESEVIDIDDESSLFREGGSQGGSRGGVRNVKWGNTGSNFDSDDEELTLPKSRFN